ncbi:IclR family transcriptional regulator [Haloferax denitrificans]|uniref:IclR family transcriptional regulator n=1 Tax=Haloferax denitrificans TaxID=35745 RepID=UPI003C6FB77C
MDDSKHQLATVNRTFDILGLLRKNSSMSVSEIAKTLDTHRSTIHGYLRTLEATGFVINENGRYRLGLRFLEFGGRIKYRNRLFQVSQSELEHLADDTGYTASLTIEENNELAIVHLAEGERSLQLGMYTGMRVPLHSHASGKSILAYSSDEVIDRFFETHDLEAVTKFTKTDPDDLRAEFETIRETGYAYDWDEQVVGMGIISAPITVEGTVYGAIGLVCPTNQLTDADQRSDLAERVKQSTDIISVNYQYGR